MRDEDGGGFVAMVVVLVVVVVEIVRECLCQNEIMGLQQDSDSIPALVSDEDDDSELHAASNCAPSHVPDTTVIDALYPSSMVYT